MTGTKPSVEIISFGYGHADPPPGAIAVDLRTGYRDPHFDPALRELTAADPRVSAHVLATPGVDALVKVLFSAAFDAWARHGLQVTFAIGCTGGRNRAPAVATELGARLAVAGVNVALTHRDIGKPVIRREQASAAGSLR